MDIYKASVGSLLFFLFVGLIISTESCEPCVPLAGQRWSVYGVGEVYVQNIETKVVDNRYREIITYHALVKDGTWSGVGSSIKDNFCYSSVLITTGESDGL